MADKSGPKTAPLFMHIVQASVGMKANHWATLKFKMSIKKTLPMMDLEQLKAFSALEKPNNDHFRKKRHLTFHKPDSNDADKRDNVVVALE